MIHGKKLLFGLNVDELLAAYQNDREKFKKVIYKLISNENTEGKFESVLKLKNEIKTADAIVIGAGAGLSVSAGLTYSGEKFQKYFFDFAAEYDIRDMYSGGFYPFPDEETGWAWWA